MRCIDCLRRKKCPVVRVNPFKQFECRIAEPDLAKLARRTTAKRSATPSEQAFDVSVRLAQARIVAEVRESEKVFKEEEDCD